QGGEGRDRDVRAQRHARRPGDGQARPDARGPRRPPGTEAARRRRQAMTEVANKILTTHAGSLPRPEDLADMVWAHEEGKPVVPPRFEARLTEAISEVVQRQRETGIDIVNDGEFSKVG